MLIIDGRAFEDYLVSQDETSILLLKMIEQAIRDAANLKDSDVPIEQQYHATAISLLTDINYYISWGEYNINIEDIMEYLNIEYDWFSRKIKEILGDK